ncbi:lysophospholipid acyltransferase family protein [Gleimia coleocanis]|nr:lysophospholipid acyltransferase family protein [Gleimia coleocanis]
MSKPPEGMYKFVLTACRPLVYAITKRNWSGQENFPKNQPFIVIMNHVTEADAFLVMHFIADEGHAVRALAKDSLFRVPVLKTILSKSGMVPVARGTSRSGEALEAAKRAIAAGESIAFFPEGTLTQDPDLWPMQFKTGAARLALATGAPVIPVAHWGGHNIMHRFRNSLANIWKRHDIHVMAGPAIDLSDLNHDSEDRETVAEANRRMETAIREMVAQLRGEPVPTQVWDPKTSAYIPL